MGERGGIEGRVDRGRWREREWYEREREGCRGKTRTRKQRTEVVVPVNKFDPNLQLLSYATHALLPKDKKKSFENTAEEEALQKACSSSGSS